MSFSRTKGLLRIAKISLYTSECNYEISRRLYCEKVIMESVSPVDLKLHLQDIGKESFSKPKRKQYNVRIKYDRQNYKLSQDPKYREKYKVEQEINDVIKMENNTDISETKSIQSLTSQQRIEKIEKERLKEQKMRDIFAENNDNDTRVMKNIESIAPAESPKFNFDSHIKYNNDFSRQKVIETSDGHMGYDLTADEFNMDDFIKEFENIVPKPLDETNEDLSDLGSIMKPTFNFAAYADNSRLIQEYVKLGVKLYKVEKNLHHMRILLSVDLEKELPIYIQFLHDCGVPADCLGDVITKCPMILKEDMDDMKTRIRYLLAHEFNKNSIARIITQNPVWLLWATKCLDERLGHFQNEFKLNGADVRFLATKQPTLITYNFKHIHENTFTIREQMGFNKLEMKVLLLAKPRLWMLSRKKILDSFDYLHNIMKLSHIMIASQSDVLTCRKNRIQSRHEFLMELKKNQYNPKEPGYIAPKSMVVGSDEDFCRDVAKTTLETYNLFLKTR